MGVLRPGADVAQCGEAALEAGERLFQVDARFGGEALDAARRDFRRACELAGAALSIVLRDVGVSRPGARAYRYDAC